MFRLTNRKSQTGEYYERTAREVKAEGQWKRGGSAATVQRKRVGVIETVCAGFRRGTVDRA
jgi:hypothetical protein